MTIDMHAHFIPKGLSDVLRALWLVAAVLPRPVPTPILDDLIVTLFSPLLVCLLVRSEHKAPAFCTTLGEMSYPLYVVHPGLIVLATYTPVFGLWKHPNPVNASMLVVMCISLAWLVHLAASTMKFRARKGRQRGQTQAGLASEDSQFAT